MLAVGINHHTAPVSLREKVAFSPEHMPGALRTLLQDANLPEATILSTCNRMELYSSVQEDGVHAIVAWLHKHHQLRSGDLEQHLYVHHNEQAVRHIMRVASGLDSMVLGEPQILGQMKHAVSIAHDVGVMGSRLHRLFQYTFAVAKQIRTDTAIGAKPVSVAFAAVRLAQHIFSDLRSLRVLLIGAGETIELTARHLYQQGVHQITIANRSLERAVQLAELFQADAIPLSCIPEQLPLCDIVITSTGSPLPLIGKGLVERAIKLRKHKPMFMVDLAVPRDIEAEVEQLDDVFLYTIDDLKHTIAEHLEERREAAQQAESIITQKAHKFMQWLQSLQAMDTIRAYRDKYDHIREAELARAIAQLKHGVSPEEALSQLAHRLSHKFMHAPSVTLRHASHHGEHHMLDIARHLFELNSES